MKQDVFGTAGDFTTSPEISQMFGEVCFESFSLFPFFEFERICALSFLQKSHRMNTSVSETFDMTFACIWS